MENTEKLQAQEIKIQGLVDRFLQAKTSNTPPVEANHLDEDMLSAFVEGNLSEREAQPIVTHLVDCSFCRHITTELVRLDMAFAEEETPAAIAAAEEQPSRISEVLSGLMSRIFGTSDGAVFAHQEDEKKPDEAENPEEKDK